MLLVSRRAWFFLFQAIITAPKLPRMQCQNILKHSQSQSKQAFQGTKSNFPAIFPARRALCGIIRPRHNLRLFLRSAAYIDLRSIGRAGNGAWALLAEHTCEPEGRSCSGGRGPLGPISLFFTLRSIIFPPNIGNFHSKPKNQHQIISCI